MADLEVVFLCNLALSKMILGSAIFAFVDILKNAECTIKQGFL